MFDFSRGIRDHEMPSVSVRMPLPFAMLMLWGVVVVLWTVVVHAPASWVVSRIAADSGVRFASVQGTVWDGSLVWVNSAEHALPLNWNCGLDLRGMDCLLRVGAQGDLRISVLPRHWRAESSYWVIPAWVPMALLPATFFSSDLEVRDLIAQGDLGDPARWNVSGRLHYGGGLTRLALQGQPYSVRMPEVVLHPRQASDQMLWELDEMDGSILARFFVQPGHRYRVELAQRLLALSPLYQGKAWSPDRIDVTVQDQW